MNGKISRKRRIQKDEIKKVVKRVAKEYGPALRKLGEGAAQEDKIIDQIKADTALAAWKLTHSYGRFSSRIEKGIDQALTKQREEFLNQSANQHDQEVRKQQREEIKEMVKGMKMRSAKSGRPDKYWIKYGFDENPFITGHNQALSDLLDNL